MDNPNEVAVFVLGTVAIIGAVAYYYSTPHLHTCYMCKKHLTMQAERYWYTVDGKDHPVCSRCRRRYG